LIAVILFCAVFWRYVLNDAISWSEEATKYLMVWLTFLGAPIALRHGGHINIDILLKAVPPRATQFLLCVINLLIVATMSIMVWKGYGLAEMGARQVASSFSVSMVWMQSAIPVGSALILMVALEHMLKALYGIAHPEEGLNLEAAWADEIRE
ncbi:MAG: TRAP transporter small permease, partial [Pseudomonadota bacterium]